MDRKKVLKRTGIVLLNLAGMALVCVLLIMVLKWWMPIYTHHGEAVDVPNVVGKTFTDANYVLGEAGLEAIIVDSIYDKSKPAGQVLDQTPGEGSRVKEGREILLTINHFNVPTMELPDIVDNCSRRQAEALLERMGFKLGPVEYRQGDKDWVLDVKVSGLSVRKGDRVRIDVPVVLVVGRNEKSIEDELPEYRQWENTEVYVGDGESGGSDDDIILTEEF